MRDSRSSSTTRATQRDARLTPRPRHSNRCRALLVGVGLLAFALAGCAKEKPAQTIPSEFLHPTTTTENPAIEFFNTTTTTTPPQP